MLNNGIGCASYNTTIHHFVWSSNQLGEIYNLYNTRSVEKDI